MNSAFHICFWQVTFCREIMGFNSILTVMESMMVNPFAVLFFHFFVYNRWSVNRFLDSDFARLSSLQTVCNCDSGMQSKELLIPSP